MCINFAYLQENERRRQLGCWRLAPEALAAESIHWDQHVLAPPMTTFLAGRPNRLDRVPTCVGESTLPPVPPGSRRRLRRRHLGRWKQGN